MHRSSISLKRKKNEAYENLVLNQIQKINLGRIHTYMNLGKEKMLTIVVAGKQHSIVFIRFYCCGSTFEISIHNFVITEIELAPHHPQRINGQKNKLNHFTLLIINTRIPLNQFKLIST